LSSASTLKHKQYEQTQFPGHFNVSQNAQKLTGDYTVKSEHEDGTYEIAVYKIVGTVIQNCVTMTCIMDNQREVGILNFLFLISGDGYKLEDHAH